jgi:hypothetical protein
MIGRKLSVDPCFTSSCGERTAVRTNRSTHPVPRKIPLDIGAALARHANTIINIQNSTTKIRGIVSSHSPVDFWTVSRPPKPEHADHYHRASIEGLGQSQLGNMFPSSLRHVAEVLALEDERDGHGDGGADED